jgi:hypothetical protein
VDPLGRVQISLAALYYFSSTLPKNYILIRYLYLEMPYGNNAGYRALAVSLALITFVLGSLTAVYYAFGKNDAVAMIMLILTIAACIASIYFFKAE